MSEAKKRLSGPSEDEPASKKQNVLSPADKDWNVDEVRGDHETIEHWELRKLFLQENMNRFPKARLICLSQVFANMEFLGCRYPEETMELVQELSYGIVESYREKKKTRLQRTFVKASSAAERKTKGLSSVQGNRSNDTSSFHSSKPYSHSNSSRGSSEGDIGRMILLVYSYNVGESAVCIIHRSCGGANIPITHEISGSPDNYSCTYKIGNDLVFTSKNDHPSKETAKGQAAKVALKGLQKQCYTFVTKQKIMPDDDGKEIVKDDIKKEQDNKTPSISESNIGNKLLKLMGWSGGGLGKNQQGIHEAISVDGVVGRSRLGLGNSAKNFHTKIKDLLEGHRQIGFPYDLKFSSEFSKDERKDIHMIAQRLGLKSKSFGKDDDRYIVVSEKTNRQDLMQSILAKGGETDKYQVIPPGGNTDGIEMFL